MDFIKRNAKRVVLESLGWLLVLAGIAALVLPGPGLLLLFAGLALLAAQYAWAERLLEPVKNTALKGAVDSVQSWPRIIISSVLAVVLLVLGVIWGVRPDVPNWWPLGDRWWLTGGWSAGIALSFSGLLAIGILVYSFISFRHPKT